MARRKSKGQDMSLEQFHDWCKATDADKELGEVSGETGSPRLTMLPVPHNLPLDDLPDEVDAAPETPPGSSAPVLRAVPFAAEPSRKVGGWSAARQTLFVEALAETGSVHLAAQGAGLSARSAYGLRIRSAPFARAWDAAQQLAVGRLSALVFERAIHGRIEQVYDGETLVAERRVPSDRLLTWLLARLDPRRFAAPWERRPGDQTDPQAEVQAAFAGLLTGLSDVPVA